MSAWVRFRCWFSCEGVRASALHPAPANAYALRHLRDDRHRRTRAAPVLNEWLAYPALRAAWGKSTRWVSWDWDGGDGR